MIYRSNLTAPDLQTYFRHVASRPMPHSQGHDVLTDFSDKADDDPVFGIYKQCGFWTHDEAAILYNVANKIMGHWLDIGGLTGWTAAHEAAAGCQVLSVDPLYAAAEFRERAVANLTETRMHVYAQLYPETSNCFFAHNDGHFNGIVIDGDHTAPQPLQDAVNASLRVLPGGVILLHDAIYDSGKEAARYLISDGWKHKVYRTPHGVVLFYHDPFVPPEHMPDPNIQEVTL